ncbi:MAG TPA: hypothetical protein VF581_12805 [Flavobacterium sp.]
MKKLLTVLLGFASVLAFAQVDDVKCRNKMTQMDSLVQAGDYKGALQPLTEVQKECPGLSETIYSKGESVLQYAVDNSTAENKESNVRALLTFYDQYDKYFPANTAGNTSKKAIALYSSNLGTPEEIYALLDKAFTSEIREFTDATALYTYFELFYNRMKAQEKMQPEQIFAKQDAIDSHIEMLSHNVSGNTLKSYDRVGKSINKLIQGTSTCENLIPYYEKTYDAKATDAIWLENAASRLAAKRCMSAPIFQKIAAASHALQPTARSAYTMATASLKAGDRNKAAEYFDQSAGLSKEASEKARLYYTIASNVFGATNKSKAKEYAKKALAVQPSMGKAYMFLAQLYANSGNECGATPFEQKAIYWLAAETARKAGEVEPNLKTTGSEKVAADYLKKAPTEAEVKEMKLGGKKITFNCWINESVVVPKS